MNEFGRFCTKGRRAAPPTRPTTMGKKKSKTLKLDAGPSTSPAYLQVKPTSGAVTLTAAHLASTLPVLPPSASASLISSVLPEPMKKKKGEAETAGAAWGHMKAPTLTKELKRELLLVKMRDAVDPKRFYRSADDGKAFPKYFQVGTIVEGAEDGKNRLTNRERKGSILAELMSDGTIRKRAKTQFLASQAAHADGLKRRFKPPARKIAGGKKRR